jgi:hypothetical protein
LAKDEVGNNEVATAVATTARINFLIVFIGPPFAKALIMFADWPEPPLSDILAWDVFCTRWPLNQQSL